MAAERVVKTEDGEKLAKVTCHSQRHTLLFLSSSNVFSFSGIRRTIYGDQCQDRSQCGAGLSRYSKVSLKAALINIFVLAMDEMTECVT